MDTEFIMDFISKALYMLPGILIGFTVHEYAHAYVSTKLGDYLPKSQGRLTLSPTAHIDPIGLALFLFMGFGWAKPVQTNPSSYKNYRRGSIMVALAGVTANLITVIVFTLITKIFFIVIFSMNIAYMGNTIQIILDIFDKVIWVNIILMLFNLIPIPPLDGFQVLFNIIGIRGRMVLEKILPYSTFILMAFIISPLSDILLRAPINWIYLLIVKFLAM